ncbi:hypothetical protein MMC07_009959 [Pseudocyphellaria aurata]|nr:hypothetical protein [Pseudocyphellaria aurata]
MKRTNTDANTGGQLLRGRTAYRPDRVGQAHRARQVFRIRRVERIIEACRQETLTLTVGGDFSSGDDIVMNEAALELTGSAIYDGAEDVIMSEEDLAPRPTLVEQQSKRRRIAGPNEVGQPRTRASRRPDRARQTYRARQTFRIRRIKQTIQRGQEVLATMVSPGPRSDEDIIMGNTDPTNLPI